MIRALDISTSALTAQRIRLDVIAGNIANADTTHQEDGRAVPYRRRFVTFQGGDGCGGPGVHVGEIGTFAGEFELRYDPGNPHADANGYVARPTVDLSLEYVDALAASRAYEMNAAMLNVSRGMIRQSLRLLA